MRNATVTTVVDAAPEKAFAYLADIENLPDWATEFARELRREGDDYKVVNGLGEFYFRIEADPTTGVIDMYAGLSKSDMAVFPTRVIRLPDGRSAYTFTMFQGPDMPTKLFESQRESLQREFANIERALSD
jgi:Polyketide cyclase / dehydrase and lipid transport